MGGVVRGYERRRPDFQRALPKADEPVRIVLEPAGKAQVRVEGPDGRPLGGVKVLPERLKTHYTNIPDAVALLAAATTGPDGLAVIDAVTADELSYVDVHSPEFGIQGRPIVPKQGRPPVISLRRSQSGKAGSRRRNQNTLAAGKSGHGRGSAVTPTPSRRRRVTWRRRLITRAGSTLAPIAVGGLQLQLKPPGDLPVLADIPRSLAVREGREQLVEIPLKARSP